MCYSFCRHSTATVAHNDGSSEVSDWVIPLRLAQGVAPDWLTAVLAFFLRLAVVAPQDSQTRQSVRGGCHVDAWFCVNRCTSDG